ncbi:TetR family transcriptional regulator [Brevibacillus ginsengisoli]|uniref:TetR family transcriptional regulator n=1 Tax=Brevibacillus ginsengisoli TaxID=363854 RepID=UPI003CEE9C17
MATFREERAQEKKLTILRTAAQLFNEKGYHGTTIEDIANRMRLTKGAIYYYVNSKDDLLYQCHKMIATKCIEQIKEIAESELPVSQKLEKAIESLILNITEEKAVFNIINRPSMVSEEFRNNVLEQRAEYEQYFQHIIAEGIEQRAFHSENPTLTRLLMLGSANSIANWFSPDGSLSSKEIAEFYSKTLVKSILV